MAVQNFAFNSSKKDKQPNADLLGIGAVGGSNKLNSMQSSAAKSKL